MKNDQEDKEACFKCQSDVGTSDSRKKPIILTTKFKYIGVIYGFAINK